jgi:predicted NAD/FAD-dependent oxidoreductase
MGERVGIVGAGPAGLTAAYRLARLGYDAVVFEASERVGGKCRTAVVDGARVELGAVVATPGYTRVLSLAGELGVELKAAPSFHTVTLDGRVDRQLHLPSFGPATAAACARLVAVLARYRNLAKPGYGALPEDVRQPIAGFLERHGLGPLRDALMSAYTGYGYGYDDEIPAAYLLKMCYVGIPAAPGAWATWVRAVRACGDGPLSRYGEGVMFADGYQGLWDAVARRCDVRLGCPVSSIDRSGRRVRLRAGANDHEVDRLLLAVDPRAALAALGDDADADERDALSSVRYLDYCTVLCELTPRPQGRALFIVDNARSDRRGRPVICAHTATESRLCQVYLYGRSPDGPALAPEAIADAVATDLGRLGHRLERVAAVERWRYFPHLAPDRIAWFYDLMERRQGARRTFYLGEVMSFSTVESVVRHAQAVVAAGFPAQR